MTGRCPGLAEMTASNVAWRRTRSRQRACCERVRREDGPSPSRSSASPCRRFRYGFHRGPSPCAAQRWRRCRRRSTCRLRRERALRRRRGLPFRCCRSCKRQSSVPRLVGEKGSRRKTHHIPVRPFAITCSLIASCHHFDPALDDYKARLASAPFPSLPPKKKEETTTHIIKVPSQFMRPKPTAPHQALRRPPLATPLPIPPRILRRSHERLGGFGAGEEGVDVQEPGFHVDDDLNFEGCFDGVAEGGGGGVARGVPGKVVTVVGDFV